VDRYTQKDYKETYFVFLCIVYKFMRILEVCFNFWRFKPINKFGKEINCCWVSIRPIALGLMSQRTMRLQPIGLGTHAIGTRPTRSPRSALTAARRPTVARRPRCGGSSRESTRGAHESVLHLILRSN
jgi:hypothetical protein